MSNEIAFACPASRAIRAAPTAPPAGPETSTSAAWSAASSVVATPPEERITTARHFRVFPGEGVHSKQIAELVTRLHELGYRGDYSFEVFNDDYVQLPASLVTARARQSVKWLTDHVSRRSLPMRKTAT